MDDVELKAKDYLLKLLNTVDERLIIAKKNGRTIIGGEEIGPDRSENLNSEANFILQSETYRIIKESMIKDAQERMFIQSTNFDDMRSGKVQLLLIDMIDKTLKAFSTMKR